jgi:hypothetical protein
MSHAEPSFAGLDESDEAAWLDDLAASGELPEHPRARVVGLFPEPDALDCSRVLWAGQELNLRPWD